MLNNVYLDVAIGMVFIFLLYSLLTTAIQELIATGLSLRGKYLKKAIMIMLDDIQLGDKLGIDFFDHPLIRKSSFSKSGRIPSYIRPELFSVVLQDVLPDLYLGKDRIMTIKERIKLLPSGELKTILNARRPENSDDIDKSLQTWFDASMERLSGTYKRSAQKRLLMIGFLVAAVFNVDSITLFQRLSTDQEARDKLVNQAIEFAETHKEYEDIFEEYKFNTIVDSVKRAKSSGPQDSVESDSTQQTANTLSQVQGNQEIDSALFERYMEERQFIEDFIKKEISPVNTTVGIGWGSFEGRGLIGKVSKMTWTEGILMFSGWILTAIAISLGAPFWFDLLQRFVRVRGAGKKPLTREEKDRFVADKGGQV